MAVKIFFFIIIIITLARIPFLMKAPPFVDEAIYANYAYEIAKHPSSATILRPLKEGITPVFIYFNVFFNLLISNPIFSGRLTSLFFYILAILILKKLLYLLKAPFKLPVLVFFITNPFIFLYSQMAMQEMTAIFFSLLFIYITERILLVKNIYFWKMMLLSFTYFMVIMTKFTMFALIFYLMLRLINEKRIKKIVWFWIGFIFIYLISLPITTRIWVTFSFHTNQSRLNDWGRYVNNIRLISIWIFDYFGWFFIILLGVVVLKKHNNRVVLSATTSLLLYVAFLIFTATNFFPRYLIIATVFFTLILSQSPSRSKVLHVIYFIIFIYYVVTDGQISFGKMEKANIAREDIYQYAADWTSGKNILHVLEKSEEKAVLCVYVGDYDYFLITKKSYFNNKKISLISRKNEKMCPRGLKLLTASADID